MAVEICTIGGYSETGKNSTAIKIDDEIIILDMGLHMENYIRYTEDEEINAISYEELLKVNAVPNYALIEEWKNKVVGIVPSHGHLDHLGAVPFASKFFPKAKVVCTPYTAEVLKSIIYDENLKIDNKIISVNPNSSYQISKKINIELVNITHSIPHTAMIILHTPYGKIVYANDYKFDRQPTLGKTPDFDRLKEIGKEGVLLLVVESLYAHEHKKMPSESVAKEMLKDVMLGVQAEGKAIIATTFSSHLARLKSMIELGNKLNRKVILLGRSLSRYVFAGQNIGIIDFGNQAKLVAHKDKVEKTLNKIQKDGKEKYLLIVTGHQGEPKAILSKMVKGKLGFKFSDGDVVIFSCSVIPAELNRNNRQILENELKSKGVRIFRDIHVSGHAAREDHRDLLEMLKPKYIIPSHTSHEKSLNLVSLAEESGYKLNKNIYLMEDGKRLTFE